MGLFSTKKKTTVNNTTENFSETLNQAAQDNAIVASTAAGGVTNITTTDFDAVDRSLGLVERAAADFNQRLTETNNSIFNIADNAINQVRTAFATANTDTDAEALKENQRTTQYVIGGLVVVGGAIVLAEAFGNA